MIGVPSALKSSAPVTGSTAWVPSPASRKACTADGLVMVWSTIRLEMIRGSESTTLPSTGPVVAKLVLVMPLNGASSSSLRNCWSTSSGKSWSAAPKLVCPWTRLFNEPSTVRRPKGNRELGSRDSRSAPAACCSEIRIWSRMNCRSLRIRCRPLPGLVVGLSSGIGAGGATTMTPVTGVVAAENRFSSTPLASW
ncbi:hypothetical protein FQZ97_660650 [compost metagenome]